MASPARASGSEIQKPVRVLLVDDEANVRRMLQRCLVRAGFATVEARDGQAALELLRSGDFDLVVSDVQMPVMTGVELLAALEHEGFDVPVLLISGSFEVADANTARELGAFDFFRKPFSMSELARAARQAVQSNRTSMHRLRAREAVDVSLR